MSLTSQQKTIIGKIKIEIDAVEETYPTDPNVRALHYWLGKGLDTLEGDLTEQEFLNFGGGGTGKSL